MTEQLHAVDFETCIGDGICAEVCPENAIELVNEKAATAEDRVDECLYCGQCVAVCPTESLQMPKLEMENFRRLENRPFEYDEFFEFLRSRRSVRVFKDRPVEREVIDKILQAASTAPMAFPPHTTRDSQGSPRPDLTGSGISEIQVSSGHSPRPRRGDVPLSS
jgi:ferredoxin